MTPFKRPGIFPLLALAAALGLSGCLPDSSPAENRQALEKRGAGSQSSKHPVTIRSGPATPVIRAAALSADGQAVSVSCSTCHATRTPNSTASSGEAMHDFHRGLAFRHGGLTCLSCHNSSNYDTLRLADGASLDYPNTIRLCSQCHGPQYRDYQHDTHGGMNGHWDLARGPRTRNTCVDCHDPHAPAYPQVRPVFPPRDRGIRDGGGQEHH